MLIFYNNSQTTTRKCRTKKTHRHTMTPTVKQITTADIDDDDVVVMLDDDVVVMLGN